MRKLREMVKSGATFVSPIEIHNGRNPNQDGTEMFWTLAISRNQQLPIHMTTPTIAPVLMKPMTNMVTGSADSGRLPPE